jgi:hypothetical protein
MWSPAAWKEACLDVARCIHHTQAATATQRLAQQRVLKRQAVAACAALRASSGRGEVGAAQDKSSGGWVQLGSGWCAYGRVAREAAQLQAYLGLRVGARSLHAEAVDKVARHRVIEGVLELRGGSPQQGILQASTRRRR